MEGREKNAETQAGCHRHVLHRTLAAASPKRKCDRLFKVTSPAAHTHLTRARCHGLLARSAATNICPMAAVLALVLSPVLAFWDCNDNDEYTTSSLSLPAVNRYSRTAIALARL